ncbi:C-terminal binding protein [Streptomyces sp. TRM72054]|uniref:C-terminal binding protein n=1 Tax=Streptomyces sp. TRM72054 TaxID=2870562 RepID=UPI0027DFC214|nr:C-terminal binding protein [Streptomyces sp. TRM72054]
MFAGLGDLDPAPGVALLAEAGFDVRIVDAPTPDAIVRAAADAVALLVGCTPIDAALLDQLPTVRIVAACSAGYDHIDIDAARARGLWVSNLPDAATEEVAVHALASALSLIRHLPQGDALVRAGGWNHAFAHLPRRASHLTLGLIGMGRVACRLARLAKPIFGRIAAHDPHCGSDRWPAHVEGLNLDELVGSADILSLHAPLNDSTLGLIGRPELALMPKGSYLVNVSRGGLIDHKALRECLDDGHLAGAALDVLATEPPSADDALRTHPRVLLSPHIAYLSDATLRAYVEQPAADVIAWHRAGRPLNAVVQGRPSC